MTTPKQVLETLREQGPRVGSRWRHYKGGVYEVLLVALREGDIAPMVIYKSADGVVWVRDLQNWRMRVTWQGQVVPRYTEVA